MKRHYIPVTAGVPGVNGSQIAFIRKVIRTALAARGRGRGGRRRTPARGWYPWGI